MTVLYREPHLQGNRYGDQVFKAAQALPQTATATLYTVTGCVLVTAILGRVTTVLGGTVTTLSLGITGANAGIATAVAVTSAAAGTLLYATPPASGTQTPGALIVAGGGVLWPTTAAVPGDGPLFVSQNITWTTSASDTGQVEWYLWYVPVSPGSGVS